MHTYIRIFFASPPSPPNLPTKITPSKIARLKLSSKSPMGLRIPPLIMKIMLESNHLKSRILVRRLAVSERSVPLVLTSVTVAVSG